MLSLYNEIDLNQELRQMLSLYNEITNSSLSTAEHHPKAQAGEEKPFRKIGAGACGAVFAQDGVAAVVKLAKSDDHLELWNDYLKHTAIAAKIQRYAKFGRYSRRINDVRIPACHYFIPKERTSWFDHHRGLGTAAEQIVNLPTAALVTERITPLPLSIRIRLVEKYCAERIKKTALADPANQDCLVRVYLGSMKGKSGQAFFSLRNFKLHRNQMVELGLDVEVLAKSMGKALAIMHWAARTDARDVEFVLGVSSGDTSKAPTSEQLEDLPPCTYTGRIELFVLDFNQVRSITLDEAGVALAVEAVRLNDPYYPTPVPSRTLKSVEQQVWEAFSRSYLVASYEILVEELGYGSWSSLPRKFISGLWEGIETTKMMQMTDYNYEF
jgi:hypothetical protein